MKNSLPLLLAILIFVSCSEQKFSFRKKIRVHSTEQVNRYQSKQEIIEHLEATNHLEDTFTLTDNQVFAEEKQTSIERDRKYYVAHTITKKPSKQVYHSIPTAKPTTSESELISSGSLWAIAGVILAVVALYSSTFIGIFLFAIAAIICSIIGMTSSLKWLARIGLIIGIIDIFLLILIVAFEG